MHVDLVTVTTPDGLRLDGVLRRPDAPSQVGIDVAVLHHGFGGSFYNASLFETIAESLLADGCAVLRVNSRGHDALYSQPGWTKGPLGGAAETIDDCRFDYRAWVDFASAAGFRRIALWGHSLGAIKTIYYLATEQDARVVIAIASSPGRLSYAAYQRLDESGRVRQACELAEELVASGRPDELIGGVQPTPGGFHTARAYLDKFGPRERYNILDHVMRIRPPTFVTFGALEGVSPDAPDWLLQGGLAREVGDYMELVPNLTVKEFPGADHAYTDKRDDLYASARIFLRSVAR